MLRNGKPISAQLNVTTMTSSDFCPGSSSPFWLGMADFDCCGMSKSRDKAEEKADKPKTKWMKLSLSKQKPLSPSSRFNVSVTEDMVGKSSKGIIPKGTAKATIWAQRTFYDWITQRNKRNAEVIPSDLFDKPYPIEVMNSCLQRFVYLKQEE